VPGWFVRCVAGGERDHTRRTTLVLQSREDAGLLAIEPFKWKCGVGVGGRRVRDVRQQPLHARAARIAAGAGGEVLLLGRRRRVEHAELDETILGKVIRSHVALHVRSSTRRSFRTARNKCTRTVASLNPSA